MSANALKTQSLVIWALILREIHTIYGGERLGYLWVLLQTIFGISVFWALRVLMRAHMPHGMSIPAFLVTGFSIWHIFSEILTKSMAAEAGNRTLLTFPQITPLDLIVARAVVITATHVLVTIIVLASGLLLGYPLSTPDFGSIFMVLGLTFCFSLGAGLTITALSTFVSSLSKIVPMILRIMFFTSGVFFSLSSFPHSVRPWLAWNPVLQLIEWMRAGLAPTYIAASVNSAYLVGLSLLVMTMGLLLERYVRRFADSK